MNLRRLNINNINYLDYYNLNLKDIYLIRRGKMFSCFYNNIYVRNNKFVLNNIDLFKAVRDDKRDLSELVKIQIVQPIIAGSYAHNHSNEKQDMIVVRILPDNNLVYVKFSDILTIEE